MFETLAGFLLVAGNVGNHAGMQFLENRVPVRPGKMIDSRNCALGVVGTVCAPRRQQGRGEIRDRPANRLRELAARDGVLLALEVADAENQPRHAVVLVGLHDAFREFHGLIDVPIHKERQEGAVEQLAVVRITFESRPVIGRRGAGVALLASVTGREVTARSRRVGQFQGAQWLRGKFDRCCRDKGGKRAAGNAAAEARRRHGRCSN